MVLAQARSFSLDTTSRMRIYFSSGIEKILKIFSIAADNIPVVCHKSPQTAVSHAPSELAVVGTATIETVHVSLVHKYWFIFSCFNSRHVLN